MQISKIRDINITDVSDIENGILTIKAEFFGRTEQDLDNTILFNFKEKKITVNGSRALRGNFFLKVWNGGGLRATEAVREKLKTNSVNHIFVKGFSWTSEAYKNFNEEYMNRIETYMLYLDLVEHASYFPFFENGVVPKGYVKYLKDNGLFMTKETYNTFLTEEVLKPLNNQQKTFVKNINECCDITTDELKTYYSDLSIYDKLNRIVMVTAKNGKLGEFENITGLFNTRYIKYFNSVDTSKGINDNIAIINGLIMEEKYGGIGEKLQRLNFLNGTEIGQYTIVIPQRVKDLVDEGMQQHNCVGSYYNDSIMEDKNLILFIRKTENKDKSYITARYNLDNNKITEYRYKNNEDVDNDNEIDIINYLSHIIANTL